MNLYRLVPRLLAALLPLLLALYPGPVSVAETNQAVRSLPQDLRDESHYVREHAARMLGRMGPEAAGAVPELIAMLGSSGDAHCVVRTYAIWALDRIGADPSQLVPALLPILEKLRSDSAFFISFGDPDGVIASKVISNLGEAAVPALTLALQDKDSPLRGGAALALRPMGPNAAGAVPALIGVLEDEPWDVRRTAIITLGEIGPKAAAAVPVLRRLMLDENVGYAAQWSLVRIGFGQEELVGRLTEALTDRDVGVRWRAALALKGMGTLAAGAAPALRHALDDEPGRLSVCAAEALLNIGAPADQVLPALVRAMESRDSLVRHDAAWALGRLGPGAKTAIPLLLRALEDEDNEVQWAAAVALGQMGEGAVDGLVQLLDHEDPRVRQWAARALGETGPAAKSAAARQRRAVEEDTDKEVRATGVWAMGTVGGESVIPALSAALEHEDPRVRVLACDGLRHLNAHAAEAVPALAEALSCQDPEVRKWAAIGLGEKAPRDKHAIRALAAALGDNDPNVRLEAARALRAIGPAAKEAEPALVESLSRPRLFDEREWDIGRAGAFALQSVGPDPDADLPPLLGQLAHTDASARAAAAVALGGFGNAADVVVPALAEALRDQDPGVRVSAASALEVLGAAAEAAEPVLGQALKDRNERVREAAAWALRAIFPGPFKRGSVWHAHMFHMPGSLQVSADAVDGVHNDPDGQ